MNRRSSSSKQAGDETNNELETLFEEIDEIEKILEPLNNAESDSLRSQTEDKKKKLELLDDSALSSIRLRLLRKEISKLKARAESLANNSFIVTTSFLRNELDEIEKILEPIKDAESDTLRLEKEDKRKKLESIDKKELPAIQKEIHNIKERAEILVTKSFLSGEIDVIEKILVSMKGNPLKSAELKSLEDEKEKKKERLQSVDENELVSLRKEISKMKERAESLASKESWLVRLSQVSVLVWLGIIPLLLVLYTGYVAILQWNSQPVIHIYATETAVAVTQTAQAMPTPTETPIPTPTLVP
jgi:predicted AAA+ superfamily ATPase